MFGRRIHSFQQTEFADCGIACIRVLCRYYGLRVPMSWLREKVEVNRLGMSVRDMVAALESMHMHATAVRVGIDLLPELPLPAVLYWNKSHFVVLYRVDARRGRYHIMDPAEGKKVCSRAQLEECFAVMDGKGVAVLADPREDFLGQQPSIPRGGRHLGHLAARAVKEHARSFGAVCGLMLLGMAADVALPFVFQRTIDDGISNRDVHLIWLLVFSQLFIFLGSYVSGAVVDYLLTRMGLRMSIKMINEYLNKIIHLPMSFFARKLSSDLIQKVDDHNRIQNFMVSLPDTILFTTINVVLFSGLMIYFSPAVFVVFVVFTLLSVGWTVLFLRRRREVDYACYSKQAENRNNLYELVNGIDEIKVNCAQHQRRAAWETVQKRINDLSLRQAILRMYQQGGNVFFVRLRDICVTGICATLVVQGSMTIGLMMTISYIVGRLSAPFSNLIGSVNMFQDVNMSYDRLEEVMTASVEERPHKELPPFESIDFRGVWFKYPGAGLPMVLCGLDMSVRRGVTTAIVGESGCGKSTVLKLLFGFFNPAQGEVAVGHLPLCDIDEPAWLEGMAVVMQTGTLFSGDILTNIALSDATPSLERAREAARVACIDGFIESLPMGYGTRIGRTGLELSGGQQQRLLIARAVYRRPEIIVLDEATSALDATTERRVVENIMDAFSGRTVVVVAHRLSTVRRADCIVVMDRGRVAESGTHEQLMARRGTYYHLVLNQLETAPEPAL